MRYEVPQFIDIEDKIFGPLSFKQALYIAGSAGLAFVLYTLIDKISPVSLGVLTKLILVSPAFALGAAFAFLKINKRPFIKYVESLFYFYLNPKRYIWNKNKHNLNNKKNIQKNTNQQKDLSNARVEKRYTTDISRSKLKDLAWSLDMDTDN